MAAEFPLAADADASASLAPGPLIRLARGALQVDVAPQAGGRIAQITHGGAAQLVGYDECQAMIGWGCYPMVPWAGRIRDGRFTFDGRDVQLPLNLGAHAIHGVGFAMPWRVESRRNHFVELSLALPQDERWPFGGTANQRIKLGEDRLELRLSVRAGLVSMPAVIGWHPWFRKPSRLRFSPSGVYPRDGEGIATRPLTAPTPSPWDDCFTNTDVVTLEYPGKQLQLSSDCSHWVVYDEISRATCVEPQSGPPDGFNIEPFVLQPLGAFQRNLRMSWHDC